MTEAERQVIDAAVLWVNDQQCASALMCLEDAVADLLKARQERRRHPRETAKAP